MWLVLFAALVRIGIGHEAYQWDFRVFHAAPAVLEIGGNPYDKSTPGLDIPSTLSYLYPPIVLYVFKPLADLPFSTAYVIFYLIKLAALTLLIRLWHKHFQPLDAQWLVALFFIFAFNSAILRDLTAGNIAIIEQLALWTAFYCILRDRLYLAGAIIAVVAQFKLMPVVLIGLLLLVSPSRGIKPFFASVAIFVAIFALNFVFLPEMTWQYIASFGGEGPNLDERGEINPSSLAMLRDVTAVALHMGFPVNSLITMVLYFLYVGSIGILVLWAARKYRNEIRPVDPRLLIYCGCALFVLVMPRVKDYTYIILLMPTLAVLRGAAWRTTVPLLGVLLFLPSTDPYVSGLGNSFATWLRSYASWIVAWGVLYYLVQMIISSLRQQDHPGNTLTCTAPRIQT